MKNYLLRRWAVVAAITLIVLSIVLFNVLKGMKEPPRQDAPKAAQTTAAAVVVNNTLQRAQVSIDGRLSSENKIQVFTEVNGRLLPGNKAFKDGVAFKKGEVLLQLDDRDARLNLVSMRSAFLTLVTGLLADIKVDYPEAFDTWEAYVQAFDPDQTIQPLPTVKNGPLKNFLVARNVYNQFYSIKAQEVQVAKYTIVAPFDGVVTQANVNPMTILRAGQQVGMFIDPNNFELEAGISLDLVDKVAIGNEVILHSKELTGEWKGTLHRISEALDPMTQTAKVYVKVAGNRLYEGAYLNGLIQGVPLDTGISIPAYLMVDESYVYTIDDDTLVKTKVNVIHSNNDQLVVQGLNDGDVLLNQVVSGAREGLTVIPQIASQP